MRKAFLMVGFLVFVGFLASACGRLDYNQVDSRAKEVAKYRVEITANVRGAPDPSIFIWAEKAELSEDNSLLTVENGFVSDFDSSRTAAIPFDKMTFRLEDGVSVMISGLGKRKTTTVEVVK